MCWHLVTSVHAKDTSVLEETVFRDMAAMVQARQGLIRILADMKVDSALFHPQKDHANRLPGRALRQKIRQIWQAFLEHMMALDLLGKSLDTLKPSLKKQDKKALFYCIYAVFLTRYRFALSFMEAVQDRPVLETLLNEPQPELGIDENVYSHMKSHFLGAAVAAEFGLMEARYRFYGEDPPEFLARPMASDREFLQQFMIQKNLSFAVKNAVSNLQDMTFRAWLPVQSLVAEWMGDTKVWRQHSSLITPQQIAVLRPLLEPGDILLSRHEWYLSNLGLPGYWTHAMLYVGNPMERKQFFKGDPPLTQWCRMQGIHTGDFESLVRFLYRDAYLDSLRPDGRGNIACIIESKSEGVSPVPLEEVATADSLAVLRPRLSKRIKAKAILRAFSYNGRPYDFNFDFLTDSQLVCTELVYKAYEGDPGRTGLQLPLENVMGRSLLTANDMVKLFDGEYGTEKQQLDLVIFLDGHEGKGKAQLSNVGEFRKSWKRPKWHVMRTLDTGRLVH